MSCCKRQQQGVVTEVLHRHLICLSPLKEEENNREGGKKKRGENFFFVTDGRGCSEHKSMVGFRSVLQGTVQEYTTASWLNLPHRSESGIRHPKGRLTKRPKMKQKGRRARLLILEFSSGVAKGKGCKSGSVLLQQKPGGHPTVTFWEGSCNKGVPMICISYFPHARILLLQQNKTSLAALILSDLLQRHIISPKFCCVGGILCSPLKILYLVVLFFFFSL